MPTISDIENIKNIVLNIKPTNALFAWPGIAIAANNPPKKKKHAPINVITVLDGEIMASGELTL